MKSYLKIQNHDASQIWIIEPTTSEFKNFTCYQMHGTSHAFPMTASFMIAFAKRVHGNGGEVTEVFGFPNHLQTTIQPLIG